MSSSGKTIKVFYGGGEQTLRVYDGTPESAIIATAKRTFHITEDASRIFLQDEDGAVVVTPPVIPDNWRVFLYVEPSMVPTSRAPSSSASLLPGFKWDPTVSTYDGPPLVTNNGYTLGDPSMVCQTTGWTPVVSTQTYDHGKLYCKMTVSAHYYCTIGFVPPTYDGEKLVDDDKHVLAFWRDFRGRVDCEGKIWECALLLDMEKKEFKFYVLKPFKDTRLLSIPYDSVKIYAWCKSFGFTVHEGGSSPIPSGL